MPDLLGRKVCQAFLPDYSDGYGVGKTRLRRADFHPLHMPFSIPHETHQVVDAPDGSVPVVVFGGAADAWAMIDW